VVSTPQISIGPAGSRINRDYARRGWAAETGHPSLGPRPFPSLSCCLFLAALAPRQSETAVWGVAASSVSVAWAKSLEHWV